MFGRTGTSTLARSRWAAIGAAVAVSLGAGGVGLIAHAASSAPSSFVSITPCRLFDTRASEPVGDRSTPLTANETFVRQVTGTNGNCAIPAGATAINYNLTIPNGLDGYLTLYPADAARPNASSINPVTGEGVKVNGGTVGLSAAGAVALYSLQGPLDAILDITGYFVPAGAGPAGPALVVLPVPPVPPVLRVLRVLRVPGAPGFAPWEVIPSGQTVTGTIVYDTHQDLPLVDPDADPPVPPVPTPGAVGVDLPGTTPEPLDDTTVNFGTEGAADADLTCDGNSIVPTAPAGMVCIYIASNFGIDVASVSGVAGLLPNQSFMVAFEADGADTDEALYATWAYTAP